MFNFLPVLEKIRYYRQCLPACYVSAAGLYDGAIRLEISVYQDTEVVMDKISSFIENDVLPAVKKLEDDGFEVIDLMVWIAAGKWRAYFKTEKKEFWKIESDPIVDVKPMYIGD